MYTVLVAALSLVKSYCLLPFCCLGDFVDSFFFLAFHDGV